MGILILNKDIIVSLLWSTLFILNKISPNFLSQSDVFLYLKSIQTIYFSEFAERLVFGFMIITLL